MYKHFSTAPHRGRHYIISLTPTMVVYTAEEYADMIALYHACNRTAWQAALQYEQQNGNCDKTCRHIVPLRLRGNVCKKPDLSFHVRKRGHPGQRRTTNMHCGCYNTSSRIPTLAHGKWPPAKTSARRQWSAPSKGTTTIHTKYPSTKRFFRRTLTVGKTFACG